MPGDVWYEGINGPGSDAPPGLLMTHFERFEMLMNPNEIGFRSSSRTGESIPLASSLARPVDHVHGHLAEI
jgi:hypothetical protein